MYSVLFKPQYVYFHEIWAVYENGDEEKLKIQNLFYPYNDSSLEEVFLHNRKPQKRQAIIQSLHHWYEQQAYNRSLKKIKKLKLYKFEYEFKTLVDNKNSAEKLLDVRNHPKQKIPLNESINESEAR